jgi:hypothetical protein
MSWWYRSRTVGSGREIGLLSFSRFAFCRFLFRRDGRDHLDPSSQAVVFLGFLRLFCKLSRGRIRPRALVSIRDLLGAGRGGNKGRSAAPGACSLAHDSVVGVECGREDSSRAEFAGGGRLRRNGRDERRKLGAGLGRVVIGQRRLSSALPDGD